MPVSLARLRPRLGDTCQSGEMATLLNSLSFVFNISFPPNYRVKYYDYNGNWCVSLNISVMLALTNHYVGNLSPTECAPSGVKLKFIFMCKLGRCRHLEDRPTEIQQR